MAFLRFGAFFLLLIAFSTVSGQFDPDAGRVPSYGKTAVLTVSSGINANNVRDNNHNTFWESGSALPEGYISRADLNILHRDNPRARAPLGGNAFDGNLNTMVQYDRPNSDGIFMLEISCEKAVTPLVISLKAQVQAPLRLFGISGNVSTELGQYLPEHNYTLKTIKPDGLASFDKLMLVSNAAFGLFALAALDDYPFEYVQYDFGRPVPVGQIYTRHMNGSHVLSTVVFGAGADGRWFHLATLNPAAIPMLPVVLEHEHLLRYVRIVHKIALQDYAKAAQWELKVYDKNGPFGPPLPLVKNTRPLKQRIGINGLWGWGFNTYSDNLPAGEGPDKFRKIAGKARNYHEMLWDIEAPGQVPDYGKMAAGEGTAVHWWLNWDREYAFWKKSGFEVSATVMLENKTIPAVEWGNPSLDAEKYAYAFADHFGRNGLIAKVEAGNEPWDYPPGFYPAFLEGFARGIKNANTGLRIIPAALQATFRLNEGHSYNNYAGENINAPTLSHLDGLNSHFYSHAFDNDGIRRTVHPEDPRSGLNGVRNMIRFRDHNLPVKPLHITEFGFDSQGAGEDCSFSECVSELQQAAWGIRALLLLLRQGADDAFWYFFANEFTAPVLHSRSGLSGSVNTDFKAKASWHAFIKLNYVLGDYYLSDILFEDERAYSYRFRKQGSEGYYVLAWRPIGGDPAMVENVFMQMPSRPTAYMLLDGNPDAIWHPLTGVSSLLEFYLSGIPTIFRF